MAGMHLQALNHEQLLCVIDVPYIHTAASLLHAAVVPWGTK